MTEEDKLILGICVFIIGALGTWGWMWGMLKLHESIKDGTDEF